MTHNGSGSATRPLREGQPLVWTGEFATVTLFVTRIAGTDIYRVETVQGGVVEAWTRSYGLEHRAREAAARAAAAFRAHGTVEAIAAERKRLTFVNLRALNTRGTTDEQFAAIDAQIEAVTDFDTTLELAALAAA